MPSDLRKKRFGGLTALRRVGSDAHGNALWECRCSYCNSISRKTASNLGRASTRSCGCLQRPNLTGRNFGRLRVLSKAGSAHNTTWHCRCECGNEIVATTVNLQSGNTQSCGCSRREPRLHGEGYEEAEYRIWRAMIARCRNPNVKCFRNYGGRGIKVFEPWLTSYLDFLAHVGRRPSPRHSIDRIDNNGNYEPDNVRWATPKEQQRNKRAGVRRMSMSANDRLRR